VKRDLSSTKGLATYLGISSLLLSLMYPVMWIVPDNRLHVSMMMPSLWFLTIMAVLCVVQLSVSFRLLFKQVCEAWILFSILTVNISTQLYFCGNCFALLGIDPVFRVILYMWGSDDSTGD
jgi:hypothetical protein